MTKSRLSGAAGHQSAELRAIVGAWLNAAELNGKRPSRQRIQDVIDEAIVAAEDRGYDLCWKEYCRNKSRRAKG